MRLATQPHRPVLKVALDVGIGSGEACTRASRRHFGMAPSAWRQERKSGPADSNPGQDTAQRGRDDGFPATHASEARMNVILVDRQPTPIAYFRHVRHGIGHDDPTVTEPAKCCYDNACVELAPDAVVGGQPQRGVLPGGRHACSRFEGTSDTIDAAWRSLLRDWLPGSGLQLDARPFLEHYPVGSRYDPATGVFGCELCMPVQPL